MSQPFAPVSVSDYLCLPERHVSRKRHPFNDLRLFHRWQVLSDGMAEAQSIVIRQVANGAAEAASFYRFCSNCRVSHSELIHMSCQADSAAFASRHVLLMGDSSSFNLKKHIGRIQDPEKLGVLEDNKTPGFFSHVQLALDAQSKNVLGLADILLWCRPACLSKEPPSSDWTERESYRWYLAAEHAAKTYSAAPMRTVVLDREADSYELFAHLRQLPDTHFLIRIRFDRKVWWQGQKALLSQCLAESPLLGSYELELPALDHHSPTSSKRVRRQARTAHIEVRSCFIHLPAPGKVPSSNGMPLWIIEARETNAQLVGSERPILWRLATTHPVESFEQALQCIGYYVSRWSIEQLFRTMKKQGLDLESTEQETVDAIFRQTILAFHTASRTLQLTYARDKQESQPIDETFSPEEQQVLNQLNQRFQGTTDKQRNPYPNNQTSWAAWVIARLGGWKGYHSERPPGPITFKRGLAKFDVFVQAYRMFNASG